MPLVLDASSALPWCFSDEANSASIRLFDSMKAGEVALVPAHWPLEVLSALLRGKRRTRIDDAGIRSFLLDLASFAILVDASVQVSYLREIESFSSKLQISAYDAAYLLLAQREGIAIASNDAALRRAARSEGVQIVE